MCHSTREDAYFDCIIVTQVYSRYDIGDIYRAVCGDNRPIVLRLWQKFLVNHVDKLTVICCNYCPCRIFLRITVKCVSLISSTIINFTLLN